MKTDPQTTPKGFHAMGMDFEHEVHELQNEIRANHEVAPLTFRDRHTDYFSWFNAVGKVLERRQCLTNQ